MDDKLLLEKLRKIYPLDQTAGEMFRDLQVGSRTTVQRHLDSLVERGLVENRVRRVYRNGFEIKARTYKLAGRTFEDGV